jgi:hypothetical protein
MWTGYYKLTQRNRDNFEPGNVDVFTFLAPDVGTMHSLEIGHNGKTKALNTLWHRPWSKRGIFSKVIGKGSQKPIWWVESVAVKHLATLQTMTLAGCELDAGDVRSEDQPCAMRLLVADGWNKASRRWHKTFLAEEAEEGGDRGSFVVHARHEEQRERLRLR